MSDRERREFEFDRKGESADHREHARECEKDPDKDRALPWGRFQLTSRERIEYQAGFEGNIRSDPIELLMVMKKRGSDSEEPRAWIPVAPDARRAYLNCEQRDDASSSKRARRFKAAREISHSHLGGPTLAPKAVGEIHPDRAKFEDDEEGGADLILVSDQVKGKGEQLSACACVEIVDQNKFGSAMRGPASQKSPGNDQFPKTSAKERGGLSDRDHEREKKTGMSRDPKGDGKGSDKNESSNEKNTDISKSSFTQKKKIRLWACGKPSHKKPDCRTKGKTPREEWWMNNNKPKKKPAKVDNQSEDGAALRSPRARLARGQFNAEGQHAKAREFRKVKSKVFRSMQGAKIPKE